MISLLRKWLLCAWSKIKQRGRQQRSCWNTPSSKMLSLLNFLWKNYLLTYHLFGIVWKLFRFSIINMLFHVLWFRLCVCLIDFIGVIQLKDAAQLALKKMPSAEQEALSQVKSEMQIYNLRLWKNFLDKITWSIHPFFILLNLIYSYVWKVAFGLNWEYSRYGLVQSLMGWSVIGEGGLFTVSKSNRPSLVWTLKRHEGDEVDLNGDICNIYVNEWESRGD